MTQPEDQLNLQAARAYLTRLLPNLAPFSAEEVQSLTLKAGLWSLFVQTRPPQHDLTGQLLSHLRLVRGAESDLDRLEAQHLRRPTKTETMTPPRLLSDQQSQDALQRLRQQAQQLGVPWLTRHPIEKDKTQVSYRVTGAFIRQLGGAWKKAAPKGGTRNALQVTLALAYLSLPDFRRRVRALQDARYTINIHEPSAADFEPVAALLESCGLPSRGAPTLRDDVVQLSYRTTLAMNDALNSSLPSEARTLAYLHIDLVALYLVAPEVRALIDRLIEARAEK
ncbi:hypothetical protein [Deinococcus sonorensis]|uniref:Uncharacterized protein n=2 Tax=Deinococcus sonorensis TaxID=309891 RepID=A0AAU7UF39_9DEIO